MTTLIVGNLSPATTDAELAGLFARHGEVAAVNLPVSRGTGRHRGIALVEMTNRAEAAVRAVNGQSGGGRRLTVNPARPVSTVKLS